MPTNRVLIVDDDEMIALCLRQSLELTLPDCAVDVAYSGEEALRSLARKTHNLIITDFHMPGAVDGLDLIGEARHLDADIPIILMTGFGSPGLRAKAATLGVNHYMQKPLDIERLLAVAGRLLSSQHRAAG
ncbi:MAG: response regulator [Anaerolineae bacterium]|nr:response regulator [Anaerolineae bacterium]